jgi:hypothetical protein
LLPAPEGGKVGCAAAHRVLRLVPIVQRESLMATAFYFSLDGKIVALIVLGVSLIFILACISIMLKD